MGNECWGSVTVYGASKEIARFRRDCMRLLDNCDPRKPTGNWDGYFAMLGFDGFVPAKPGISPAYIGFIQVTNYREPEQLPGSFAFSFDTDTDFPEHLFADLAIIFPALTFYCSCIDSMDDYMGEGFFNVPDGGESFRADMDVPSDYWSNGSKSGSDEDYARFCEVVDALIEKALEADRSG